MKTSAPPTDDPAVASPVNHSLPSLLLSSFLHFNSLPPLRQKPLAPAVTAAASDKGTISSVRPSFFHLL